MELSLRHEGGCWIAEGEGLCLRGASLDELDRAVARHVRAHPERTKPPLDVTMRYRRDALPEWIRPYAAHYFDRVIRIDV